jgi:hypothetical protein
VSPKEKIYFGATFIVAKALKFVDKLFTSAKDKSLFVFGISAIVKKNIVATFNIIIVDLIVSLTTIMYEFNCFIFFFSQIQKFVFIF